VFEALHELGVELKLLMVVRVVILKVRCCRLENAAVSFTLVASIDYYFWACVDGVVVKHGI
jgi:hypothetical protein